VLGKRIPPSKLVKDGATDPRKAPRLCGYGVTRKPGGSREQGYPSSLNNIFRPIGQPSGRAQRHALGEQEQLVEEIGNGALRNGGHGSKIAA
jgi:hypothetical protein